MTNGASHRLITVSTGCASIVDQFLGRPRPKERKRSTAVEAANYSAAGRSLRHIISFFLHCERCCRK